MQDLVSWFDCQHDIMQESVSCTFQQNGIACYAALHLDLCKLYWFEAPKTPLPPSFPRPGFPPQ